MPYALTMIGGFTVGRFADRFGILPPFVGGTILMCLGYILTASAPTLLAFALVSGLTIGLRSAASFAPLVADDSLWFDRYRGLAISLATIGGSLSGVVSRLVTGRSAHAPAKRAGAQRLRAAQAIGGPLGTSGPWRRSEILALPREQQRKSGRYRTASRETSLTLAIPYSKRRRTGFEKARVKAGQRLKLTHGPQRLRVAWGL
jgi:MFS family permease